MIKIHNITKKLGSNILFENLSVEFTQSTYAICGPNGAGKSSLLRMLVGIDQPDRGQVYINQLCMQKKPVSAKKLIGYCPDKPQVYSFIKAGEFIQWIQGVHGITKDTYTNELISAFKLSSHLNKPFGHLSLGTAKKFFIVASLLHRPKIIIMDEPSNAIDQESKELLIQLLKERQKHALIILATHDLSFIKALDCKVLRPTISHFEAG